MAIVSHHPHDRHNQMPRLQPLNTSFPSAAYSSSATHEPFLQQFLINEMKITELHDVLAEFDVLRNICSNLRLRDLLNLTLVSRGVREAIMERSFRRSLTKSPEGEYEDLYEYQDEYIAEEEIEEEYLGCLQHMMLLLSSTERCKSAHRIPRRIDVGYCVWCGDCVCSSCDISSYIPHSHRLRRLCTDCWLLTPSSTNCSIFPFINFPLSPPSSSLSPTMANKKIFCECKQGDQYICPDCPPERDGEEWDCW
ncbi:hypothetical protein RUND412_010562, partial [Rhizina undulata]